MRRILLLTALEIVFLAGCNHVTRPDTNMCAVNAKLGHKKCYNLLRDYDDNGELKKGALPTFIPIYTLNDLDKNVGTDPGGWANLKAYIRIIRQEGLE